MEADSKRLRALPSLLLFFIAVWEFVSLVLRARGKNFWFDEIATLHISGFQPFSRVMEALKAGMDAMPPTYFEVVRLARMLPIDPHIAIRLPSVAGYLMTLAGVYLFARKKVPWLGALTAILLIIVSPFRNYAIEARPYTLTVGFIALAAACWQRIGTRRFMTPLFALMLGAAVACHPLTVIVFTCFCVAEFAGTLHARRIRWGVWASFIVAAIPFFISLPTLLHFRKVFSKHFWALPHWTDAVWSYQTYLGLDPPLAIGLTAFVGIMVAQALLRRVRGEENKSRENDFGASELALIGSLVIYPALLVTLTKLSGGGYTPRYAWSTILGLVLACVFSLDRMKVSFVYPTALLLAIFAAQSIQEVIYLSRVAPAGIEQRWTELDTISRQHPGIPVVVGDGLIALAAFQSSPPELGKRLVSISDLDLSGEITGSDSVDTDNRIIARFTPFHVEDLEPFLAANPQFILYSGGAFDWITHYLLDHSFHMQLIGTYGSISEIRLRPTVDKSIYLVQH